MTSQPTTDATDATDAAGAAAAAGDRGPLDISVAIEIRSPFDGSVQRGMLRLPPEPSPGTRAEPGTRGGPDTRSEPRPLILAPHPFAWTVSEDYAGGYDGLRAASHRGWSGVAAAFGVAVLQPDGHHRAVEHCSLGFEGVVRDAPAWIDAVDRVVRVDRDRVYAGGLSMGALEAALMLGTHPAIFAAGFAINPVVDVAAWYEDLATTTNDDLRSERNDALIADEVGGTPDDIPVEYDRRSAFSVVDGLRGMPVMIEWSDDDLVVPRQRTRHGRRLFDAIKELDPRAPVIERVRPRGDGALTDDDRWAIHETADYHDATAWLLRHRRTCDASDAGASGGSGGSGGLGGLGGFSGEG